MRKVLVIRLACVCKCVYVRMWGWPKGSFRFFYEMLQKNPNEISGLPSMFVFLCMIISVLDLGGKFHTHFQSFKFWGMIMIHCLIHETVIKYFSFLLKNGSFPANVCRWDPLFLLVSAVRSPGKALCGVTFRPFIQSKEFPWTSLGVQWLRICLPVLGTQIQSLVWEGSTCLAPTKPKWHNYWFHAPQEKPLHHN